MEPALGRLSKLPPPKECTIVCICGKLKTIQVMGNNNADGKNICKCGRHITVHFRRHKGK